MYLLNFNFHTHTYRCGHAVGTDEEYVLKAINNGIKVLGFSDHIPFPNRTHKGMRPEYETIPDYVNSITNLKKKYSSRIELHIGYEAEYYPEYDSYYRDLLSNCGIEYLILGQHGFFKDEEFIFYNSIANNLNNVKTYVDLVIKGMESGLFLVVGHPDMILNSFDEINDDVLKEVERIIIKSVELNIPLEINGGGIRFKNRNNTNYIGECYVHTYPYDEFFSLVSKYQAPVVIGVDAHDPIDFDNHFVNEYAYSLIKKYHLNLVSIDDILAKFKR